MLFEDVAVVFTLLEYFGAAECGRAVECGDKKSVFVLVGKRPFPLIHTTANRRIILPPVAVAVNQQ